MQLRFSLSNMSTLGLRLFGGLKDYVSIQYMSYDEDSGEN